MIAAEKSNVVKAHARAFVESIQRCPQKDRLEYAAPIMIDRYNEVLEQAKQVAPDVDDALWPKRLSGEDGPRLLDIEVFAQQIVNALPGGIVLSEAPGFVRPR